MRFLALSTEKVRNKDQLAAVSTTRNGSLNTTSNEKSGLCTDPADSRSETGHVQDEPGTSCHASSMEDFEVMSERIQGQWDGTAGQRWDSLSISGTITAMD